MPSNDEITVKITFTPAQGEPIVFESTSALGLSLLNGVKGLGIAPVTHSTAARSQLHGSVLRATRLTEREIFLPVLIDAPSIQELDELRDSLIERCNPLLGPGKITVNRVKDGKTRTISAIYKDGLEGEYGANYFGDWQSFGFTFLATDAFWAGEEVQFSWPLQSTSKPFISKRADFFPVILGRTNVDNAYTVVIGGDTTAHPIWTITGPATDITVKNVTTGEQFFITGEVKATETITVDTANNTLRSNQRTEDQLWDALSLDSTLFALPVGKTSISVTATSLTKDSSITAKYFPQYLAGY